MKFKNISELRDAASAYLNLLSKINYFISVSDDGCVSQMHRAIANVNLDEMGNVLGQYDVHEYRIIEDTVRPTLEVIDGLCKVIGKNLPKLMVCNIDPNVGEVFKFCQMAKEVLEREYENLKSRRLSEPSPGDVDAFNKLCFYEKGFYGNMGFDVFIKEEIINGLPHDLVVRRLNYMISRCDDESRKWDLSKYLYWRKCERDVITELHDALVDVFGLFDRASGVLTIRPDGGCDVVIKRLYGVLEWCMQYAGEFQLQLDVCSPLGVVVDLCGLATRFCECADRWYSMVENNVLMVLLVANVGRILDNAIVPTIKQRKLSTLPEATPVVLPSPSVEATTKDDAALPDFSHMESYTPTIEFDMLALYSFLIDEGVIRDIDFDLFCNCITHAHINEIWNCTHTTVKRKRNLLQSLFKMLAEYYPNGWIDRCSANLNVERKRITNPTSSGNTMKFEDDLRNILKGKSKK